MLWSVTLHERNGLTQACDVGGEYSSHELIYRIGTPCYTPKVWVNHRLCHHPLIDLESHVSGVILWVMQSLFVDIHIVGIYLFVLYMLARRKEWRERINNSLHTPRPLMSHQLL